MIAGARGTASGQSVRQQAVVHSPAAAKKICRRTLVVQSYKQDRQRPRGEACDVVLSSGFLAFASHSGFLQAVEDAGVRVSGIMGTSAGALTGSLYAAGYSPKQAAAELSRVPPISFLRPSFEPWKGGILSLDGVIDKLRELLPPTFEDLEKEFAVGVVTASGEHLLIDSGPLPEAVAASAAIPIVFSNVEVPGLPTTLKDGGVVDRIGLAAWRARRHQQLQQVGAMPGATQPPPCLVHIIERSSPFSGCDDADKAGEQAIYIVRSPKSGVSFFDLGDFSQQFDSARQRSRIGLEGFRTATERQQQQLATATPRSNVGPAGSMVSSGGVNGTSGTGLSGVGSSAGMVVAASGNGRVKMQGSVVAASTGSSAAASGVSARATGGTRGSSNANEAAV